MTKRVLFLCPHGAAKSVLAAVYCQQLARERGLALVVDFAGTEPDVVVAPAVAELLQSEGYDVSHRVPHRVTEQELVEADWVISLGCDVAELGAAREVIRWDDVPPLSQGLLVAREMILAHVETFLKSSQAQDKG
jgi:protein-tyrosine-phosphatase